MRPARALGRIAPVPLGVLMLSSVAMAPASSCANVAGFLNGVGATFGYASQMSIECHPGLEQLLTGYAAMGIQRTQETICRATLAEFRTQFQTKNATSS